MNGDNPDEPRPPRPPRETVPPLPPPVPAGDPLTAFLQRRLESLEQDLNDERERAHSAQSLLAQQENMRSEVDAQLKAISDQIRREKAERENLETRSHDQGRIDALEKRLDEMHQTWASILKESLGRKDAVGEKTALLETFERQSHEMRQASMREQLAQQAHFNAQIAELLSRLDALKEDRVGSAALADELKTLILKSLPQSKGEIIARLEAENKELLKAVHERGEALRQYAAERRQVEESMGKSLMALNGELSAEREKARSVPRLTAELEHEAAALKDRLSDAFAALTRQEQRIASLVAERDELSKSLIDEAGRLRQQIDERRASEERLTHRINEEMSNRLAVAELRSQIATLTEHMAKALQEKDAALKMGEGWRGEREQLLSALRKKEEMLAMLSTTFQGMLKK